MLAQDAATHAMRIFDYVEDRGGRVGLEAIDRPAPDFPSPLAVFEHARDHEAKVSAGINALYELAVADKDYASQTMLQWFITEQVEEEKTSTQIVETLRMIGDNASGLYMFDKELGSRKGSD
jgi:ferritin